MKDALYSTHKYILELEGKLVDYDVWAPQFEITAPLIFLEFQGKNAQGSERSAVFSRSDIVDFLRILNAAEDEPPKA